MFSYRIIETGEIRSLSLIDRETGIDWVFQCIDNYGGFTNKDFIVDENSGEYIATAEASDWWTDVIDAENRLCDLVGEMIETGEDADEVSSVVGEAREGLDFGDEAKSAIDALDKEFPRHGASES